MRVIEMSKKSVSYIKPEEPAFLARLKQQVGYKEGPTVHTKREELPTWSSSDESDSEDQPQVVVLKPGDLTAEEAAKAKQELEEAPADLTQRVLFKKPDKKGEVEKVESAAAEKCRGNSKKRVIDKQKGSKVKHPKPVLSFEDEDEEV